MLEFVFNYKTVFFFLQVNMAMVSPFFESDSLNFLKFDKSQWLLITEVIFNESLFPHSLCYELVMKHIATLGRPEGTRDYYQL